MKIMNLLRLAGYYILVIILFYNFIRTLNIQLLTFNIFNIVQNL
jgi:hypothetical protein